MSRKIFQLNTAIKKKKKGGFGNIGDETKTVTTAIINIRNVP
jgi:hypothetical protein